MTVTFTVSNDGRSVLNLRVGTRPPDRCGSGGPVPIQASTPASIKAGRFTTKVTYRSSAGKLLATARVTGEFLKNGKEQGVVDMTVSGPPKCSLHYLPYTTTAQVTVPPVPSARYTGHIGSQGWTSVTVTFTVSTDRRSVLNLRVGERTPDGCGDGGPVPIQASTPAPIKNGKFTAKVTYRSSAGELLATARVTGEFLKNGKEQGVVDSTISNDATCSVHYLPYTTSAH